MGIDLLLSPPSLPLSKSQARATFSKTLGASQGRECAMDGVEVDEGMELASFCGDEGGKLKF